MRGSRSRIVDPVGLRVIGGKYHGKKLQYGGDQRVRPMKERVREAVFNLLGKAVEKKFAVDLFAGTGALGIEAMSRGATAALFLERHFPTSKIIGENLHEAGVLEPSEIVFGDTFLQSRWMNKLPSAQPWCVFCCPPYELFVTQQAAMLALIGSLLQAAPTDTLFVVESDDQFDPSLLPQAEAWDVRRYFPATVSIFQK
ncbi:MAG: RsmD family RNA methyltransferase [Thermoguttaceae bacterium]|nr:RsmD family RNA methyltransferase [Thermoguttaceae bacterium]